MATYTGTVDQIVEQLKKQQHFQVLDQKAGKTYSFVYEPKNQELYLKRKKRKFKVSNPGSALYSFANRSNYFELHLVTSLSKPIDISPLQIIENIELI